MPLRVTTNDIVAVHLAELALEEAHARTETEERLQRSSAEFIGEGRAAAAVTALAEPGTPAAAFVEGGLAEESLLLLREHRRGGDVDELRDGGSLAGQLDPAER